MSISNMIKTLIGATVISAAFTAPALATPPDVAPTGSFTFRGETTLTKEGLPPVTCTLTLIGETDNKTITVGGNSVEGVQVKVTSGSVTSDNPLSLCSALELAGFPWPAFIPDDDITQDISGSPLGPVEFVNNSQPSGIDARFQGVVVKINVPLVSDCSGDVAANFFNGQSAITDPSFFTFNDSFNGCTVKTTPTGLEIVPSMSSAPDVNVQ